MRRRNNKGYFSPVAITALLLALLIAGLPFITSGPIKDDDILTPLPTPETTDVSVPTQKPSVVITTKKRTDIKPQPANTTQASETGNIAPIDPVSQKTVQDVQSKALKLSEVSQNLLHENGTTFTADMVREAAGVPANEHFIVTVSVKNGNISKVSYFTEEYSVAFSDGKYSSLANVAGDDFEDAVLFL